MHRTTDAPSAAITPEGEALYELHRRLVRTHYALAAAEPDDDQREARVLASLQDALRFIAEQPAFRAVADERARTSPPPRPVDEARVARLRAKAAAGLAAKGQTP